MNTLEVLERELEKNEAEVAHLKEVGDGLRLTIRLVKGRNSTKPATKPKKKAYTRNFYGRRAQSVRIEAVMTFLREHPDAVVQPVELAKGAGIPQASIYPILKDLVAQNKVIVVDQTTRGKPIVKYRPTTIVPGEPVDVS